MSRLLCTAEASTFFTEIIKHTRDNEKGSEGIARALSCISHAMHIARVDYVVKVSPNPGAPYGAYRRDTVFSATGFRAASDDVSKSFASVDGNIITVHAFPEERYVWSQEETDDIYIIIDQIYAAIERYYFKTQVESLLTVDAKTGVANPAGFMRFIDNCKADGTLCQFDGFYFNIHNFKYVNKVLPYEDADNVLQLYAYKVSHALSKRECVGYLGGDSFMALVLHENTDYFLDFLNDVTIHYVKNGFSNTFHFSSVVGGAHLENYMDSGDVMAAVSIACQNAKKYKLPLSYFTRELFENSKRQEQIIAEFGTALKSKEFYVVYQPKVDLKTMQLYGAEALIRWKRGTKVIPPMEFIQALEDDGCVINLDFYVLDSVCAFLKERLDKGLSVVPISVNFSKHHMNNNHIIEDIMDVVNNYEIEPSLIEIEVTESEDFSDYLVMSSMVESLKKKGLSTSVDDFGTGYSSLNLLKNVQFDTLKIDKSFIPKEFAEGDNNKDMIIAKHMVELAKSFGMKTVAEGVETEEQLEFMKSLNCDIIQGYYFDKPLSQSVFESRLDDLSYYLRS